MRYILLLIVTLVLLPAQEAIVVPLKNVDADLMQALYSMRAALDNRITTENKRIGSEYATWATGAGITLDQDRNIIPPDFEYSKDFRYIVPKSYAGVTNGASCSLCGVRSYQPHIDSNHHGVR